MSNVTKNKKNELNDKLSVLKKHLHETSAPEFLIQYLKELENEIDNIKYGLVFEEHFEEIEKILETNDIKLVELIEFYIEHGERVNFLIEGENLAILKHLEKSYLGKIDIIYIDPPYNTGMTSLNYSDHDYVDKDDSFIHSKWLSFMGKRIKIAQHLLTDNGVMFINIDENETGTLIMLCQQLFGEDNVDVLIWPKTDPRFDQNRVEKTYRNIKIVHEYVIVCYKNKSQTRFNHIMSPLWLSDNINNEVQGQMETILKGLGTTSSAKDELNEIFGRRDQFQTPKPRKLIKELVRAAAGKDAIVLDFFAGSGTTGHAVMDLNQEDKGNRRFILGTNNENNICREITYKRLKKAIDIGKYKENIKYYKINFIPKKIDTN